MYEVPFVISILMYSAPLVHVIQYAKYIALW